MVGRHSVVIVTVAMAIPTFSCGCADPKDAATYVNRGNAWLSKRDYDRAIADYTEAIRLDPKKAAAYSGRGAAWTEKHDLDRAIDDYNEAIRLDPKFALAYLNRGVTWKAKGEFDRAIADYDTVIRLNPKDAVARYDRGNACLANGDPDRAIADFSEAIRLDPKFALAYNGRAWLWATCPDAKYRDGKKAVESATRACELTGWKDARYLSTLAAAYAELGDFDAAVKWQIRAIDSQTDAAAKEADTHRLELFKQKQPYRTVMR